MLRLYNRTNKKHPLQQQLLQGVFLHAPRYDLATGK